MRLILKLSPPKTRAHSRRHFSCFKWQYKAHWGISIQGHQAVSPSNIASLPLTTSSAYWQITLWKSPLESLSCLCCGLSFGQAQQPSSLYTSTARCKGQHQIDGPGPEYSSTTIAQSFKNIGMPLATDIYEQLYCHHEHAKSKNTGRKPFFLCNLIASIPIISNCYSERRVSPRK